MLFGLSLRNLPTAGDRETVWDVPSFRPEARIAGPLAVLIAVLAPVLGGSTEPWSQGLILMLLALGVCIAPPDRAPHRLAPLAFLAALLLACCTFFPAIGSAETGARAVLEGELKLDLPLTVSPQPWISFDSTVLLAAGLLWWWWLVTVLEEGSDERAQVARWTAAGMIALAAAALLDQAKLLTVPFWPHAAPLGPFPNKNQMGDLLGCWAVVAIACGVSSFKKGRWTTFLWLAGSGTLIWALLGTASRGGLAVFVGGLIVWGLLEAAAVRRLRGIAVALAAGLCALAIFFAFGGETFRRSVQFFTAVGDAESPDFRLLVFRDALRLIREAPWSGLGLGNFESVFALYRQASAVPSRALHPESDWLWLIAEMGWLAPVLALWLLIPTLRRSFGTSRESGASITRAAAVAGVMFLLHGFVDVSGHRLGSAFPGLLLLALGARSRGGFALPVAVRETFRIGAFALMAIGLGWLASVGGSLHLPGRTGVNWATAQAAAANEREDFAPGASFADQGLQWAPLDWELYFHRAVAEVYQQQPDAAQQDFRRARRLEVSDPAGPLKEGELWAYFDPSRSLEPWREALRRASTGAPGLYGQMLGIGGTQASMRPVLKELAGDNSELQLRFLEAAPPAEITGDLAATLAFPERLERWDHPQQTRFFSLFRSAGGSGKLGAFLDLHPEFLPQGWRVLAAAKAQEGDVEGAVMLAFRYVPPPPLPPAQGMKPETAQREFARDPSNVAAGYQVFLSERAGGHLRNALETLNQLGKLPRPPAYVPYLRAQILSELGDWNGAWRELQ